MNLRFWESKKEVRSNDAVVDYGSTTALSLLFGASSAPKMMNISTVYACIELISNAIASLPILIKRVDTTGKQVDSTHILNNVFEEMLMSKFLYIKKMIVDLLIDGNSFSYIQRASDGTVTDIIYLEPTDVTVYFDKKSQKLYYTSGVIGSRKIEPINMIHLVKNLKTGQFVGSGLLVYAGPILQLCGLADEQARKFFSNGCNVSGVLTTSNPNLSSKQTQDAKASWNQTYGKENNGGVVVLPQGWSYQSIGSNSADSQLLETRLFNVTEICRYFGVNPTLVGELSKSSYSSLEQAQLHLVLNTLMPYLQLLQSEFSRKLLLPSERGKYVIDFDENALLKGDKSATASYLNTLVSGGIMTRNEARHQLGLNSVDGGDELQVAYSDTAQNTIGNNESDAEKQIDNNTNDD